VYAAADGKRIFVADYAKGVFAVDIDSRRVLLLAYNVKAEDPAILLFKAGGGSS